MSDFQSISKNLVDRLSLRHEPVGVTLYGKADKTPANIPFAEKNLKSYCQAVVLAGEGEDLLLEKEKMGCKLGTSVLGFEEDMDAFLDDGVLEKYGVGLFENEEASAETILKSVYMEKGKSRAVSVQPVANCVETPQVVIFTANSEQVMWLLYAVNYETGGKMDLPQSGGALGGCADITVLPILKGMANITFLGLGCRLKSAIEPCDLMMGVPGNRLQAIHDNIMEMEKPISMLSNQNAGV